MDGFSENKLEKYEHFCLGIMDTRFYKLGTHEKKNNEDINETYGDSKHLDVVRHFALLTIVVCGRGMENVMDHARLSFAPLVSAQKERLDASLVSYVREE